MTDFDFTSNDPNKYDAVIQDRIERLKRIRATAGMLEGLKRYYKDNPADFINDWGMTFDPRNAEIGLETTIPFLLFDRQREFIEYVQRKWLNREDGLAEKSRDMGVSWLCVGFAVWMWIFHAGTVVGFGSRKEEYVDDLNDPKSLFWKIRKFIELLPKEFTPLGYDAKKHAPFMTIVNPENGARIVGESGDNIGRGNRTSIYFKDESAFYQRPDAIDAALSQTSNCKIDVSTPNGHGNAFARKRFAGVIEIFSFHWTQDPRKNKAWYEKQKRELDPVVLAQEVDIDYNASANDIFINGLLVQEAMLTRPAEVEAIGGWIVGIDAAHFGDDESVVHFRKGRLNMPQKIYQGLDGVELANKVEYELDNLLAFGGQVAAIFIELDGAGVSCHDQLRQGKYARYVRGTHTGARLSDDRNYNVRARMWRNAKEYLEQQPVCLSDDTKLKSQLSSLKYKYKDGLLIMQNKKEYKSEFGKSPDRADAFVLTFVDPMVKPEVFESKESWKNKIRAKRLNGSADSA